MLEDLPAEMQQAVFSHLDLPSVRALRRVSRAVHALIGSRDFQKARHSVRKTSRLTRRQPAPWRLTTYIARAACLGLPQLSAHLCPSAAWVALPAVTGSSSTQAWQALNQVEHQWQVEKKRLVSAIASVEDDELETEQEVPNHPPPPLPPPPPPPPRSAAAHAPAPTSASAPASASTSASASARVRGRSSSASSAAAASSPSSGSSPGG